MEYSNGYPDTAHCCCYPFRHYVGFNDQLHASTVLLSNHTTDNRLPVTCSQHGYFRRRNPDAAVDRTCSFILYPLHWLHYHGMKFPSLVGCHCWSLGALRFLETSESTCPTTQRYITERSLWEMNITRIPERFKSSVFLESVCKLMWSSGK
jgi:hypothetical protein